MLFSFWGCEKIPLHLSSKQASFWKTLEHKKSCELETRMGTPAQIGRQCRCLLELQDASATCRNAWYHY